MATLETLNVILSATIDDFEAKMDQAQSGIGRLGDATKGAGESLTRFVTVPLALLAAGAVAAYGKLDSLQRGINAITTQDLAKQGVTGFAAVQQAAVLTTARVKELAEIAKAPGIGFEQAQKGDVRLRSVGISARDAAKDLKEFANAVATSGGGTSEFDRVTVQLAQLSAKGKVLAQDLRPIIEAAPSVAAALQKLYGTIDSEDISKILEKQGKSSSDFINTLTDELAKLPRVTGGIANQLENFEQGVVQNAARLGDSLNKAFDLEGLLAKATSVIDGLVDSFAHLDPATQKLIFSLAALAAAAGPVLVAVGALGAAVPAIAAGFALLLSPVGAVVAALALLAGATLASIDYSGLVTKSYQEQATATDELKKNILPLADRYDELKTKTSLSKAEQEELRSIIERIGKQLPETITQFDEYGKQLDISTGKVRELVSQQERALRQANKGELTKQREEYRDLTADIEAVTAALKRRDAAGNIVGTNLNRDVDNPFDPTEIKLTGEQIAALQARLGALKESRKDVGALIDSLKGIKAPIQEAGDAADTAKGKLQGLTDAQQKALAALLKQLRINREESLALGDDYDYLGGKQKVLETGVKSLISAGFSPASSTVRKYAAELRDLNTILGDNSLLQARALKGLEKVGEAPEFKVQTDAERGGPLDRANGRDPQALPKRVNLLPVNDEALRKSLDSAVAYTGDAYARLSGVQLAALQVPDVRPVTSAYELMSGAQRDAFRDMLLAQEQFNAGTADLTAAFPFDAFSNIGLAIGQALGEGGDVLEAAGQALLKVLADFGIKYGEQLIALGIADIATGFFAAKGVAEIAAGTGLVAASAALGALGGGGSSRASGSAPSLGSAPRSNFTPSVAPGSQGQPATPATITHNVIITASGKDLAGSLVLTTDRLGRVLGR